MEDKNLLPHTCPNCFGIEFLAHWTLTHNGIFTDWLDGGETGFYTEGYNKDRFSHYTCATCGREVDEHATRGAGKVVLVEKSKDGN